MRNSGECRGGHKSLQLSWDHCLQSTRGRQGEGSNRAGADGRAASRSLHNTCYRTLLTTTAGAQCCEASLNLERPAATPRVRRTALSSRSMVRLSGGCEQGWMRQHSDTIQLKAQRRGSDSEHQQFSKPSL